MCIFQFFIKFVVLSIHRSDNTRFGFINDIIYVRFKYVKIFIYCANVSGFMLIYSYRKILPNDLP